jgi:hypothetical protein
LGSSSLSKKRLKAQLQRRSGRRHLGSSAVVVFGLFWLVLEPVSLVFPDLFDKNWGLFAGVVVVSAMIALWDSRPRNRITFKLPPTDLSITVAVGDVLKQTGNVVIGSNDVFDTDLSDEIISPTSVQGQLVQKVFGGDVAELDRQIDHSLGGVEFTTDGDKVFGKRNRYRIGTVAMARHGGTRYFLPAMATMSPHHPPHVTTTIVGVQTAMTEAWQTIGMGGQREPVHAPIVGSNLGRLGLSRTWIVQMMVLSFVAVAKKEGGSASLTIWVAEQDASDVDLAALDDWLRALCAS